jgi:hypothetical protein
MGIEKVDEYNLKNQGLDINNVKKSGQYLVDPRMNDSKYNKFKYVGPEETDINWGKYKPKQNNTIVSQRVYLEKISNKKLVILPDFIYNDINNNLIPNMGFSSIDVNDINSFIRNCINKLQIIPNAQSFNIIYYSDPTPYYSVFYYNKDTSKLDFKNTNIMIPRNKCYHIYSVETLIPN